MRTNETANGTAKSQKLTETPSKELEMIQNAEVSEVLAKMGGFDGIMEIVRETQTFQESYAAMAYAIANIDGDESWTILGGLAKDEHFELDQLQQIALKMREHTIGNPLLKRAQGLRSANVFGKPFKIKETIPARIQKILEDPVNDSVIGGVPGWMQNDKTAFTDGNVYLLYNKVLKEWARLPLDNVVDVLTAPDNPERVRYVLRRYEILDNASNPAYAQAREVTEWIKVDGYNPPKPVRAIGENPVNQDYVIIDAYFNSDSGQTFGIPDGLPGLPWAALYREYLKDGARVIKALASIAWVLKNKSTDGTKKSAARVPVGGVGATANMTDNMDLTAMPRSNQVDLSTGRALAAMVATACEVSVVALLSDPGQSGAYGTAKTLDAPTEQAAMARQEYWKTVIKRCYRAMGFAGTLTVSFPPISEDPDYRKTQSLSQFWATGLMHEDEARASYAQLLGVDLLHAAVPDGVMLPNNEASWERADIDPKDDPSAPKVTTPATSQGNSGAGIGDLSDGDNSGRDSSGTD